MKCEKCGLEIPEGTVCEKCKNIVSTSEEQTISNTTNKIPEQYDPVADLMNEPVTKTVNVSKSELENTIPLGDNNEIPLTPVNENVVNVSPEPIVQTEQNVSNENLSNTTQVVEEQTQTSPIQDAVQNQNLNVKEKKKTNTSTIIIIAVVFVLGLFIILFVLPLINSTKLTQEMFNQAKANTFVTEVQEILYDAKTSFMIDALENGAQNITYTNLNNISGEGLIKEIDEFEGTKSYYIELDRNGKYQKVVVFDGNYCYDSSEYPPDMEDYDKSSVSINDIYLGSKSDSQNGCRGKKPQI